MTGLLVPPGVVTVTFRGPGAAFASTVNLAVAVVGLTTVKNEPKAFRTSEAERARL
jgi:hypothetical protein